MRVPICRFGDSSHSVGTSSCNSASVEQTSLRDQPSAPAPNAVRKIPSIVMQACGPTKRRGDVRSARPLARRGRRPLAGRVRGVAAPVLDSIHASPGKEERHLMNCEICQLMTCSACVRATRSMRLILPRVFRSSPCPQNLLWRLHVTQYGLGVGTSYSPR